MGTVKILLLQAEQKGYDLSLTDDLHHPSTLWYLGISLHRSFASLFNYDADLLVHAETDDPFKMKGRPNMCDCDTWKNMSYHDVHNVCVEAGFIWVCWVHLSMHSWIKVGVPCCWNFMVCHVVSPMNDDKTISGNDISSYFIEHETKREEWKARHVKLWFQARQFTTSMAARSLALLPLLSLTMWLSAQGPCAKSPLAYRVWKICYIIVFNSCADYVHNYPPYHSCSIADLLKSSVEMFNVDLVVHLCGGQSWKKLEEMLFLANPFSDCQAELSDAKLLEWKHWSTDDLSENGLRGAWGCSFSIHLQPQCP